MKFSVNFIVKFSVNFYELNEHTNTHRTIGVVQGKKDHITVLCSLQMGHPTVDYFINELGCVNHY